VQGSNAYVQASLCRNVRGDAHTRAERPIHQRGWRHNALGLKPRAWRCARVRRVARRFDTGVSELGLGAEGLAVQPGPAGEDPRPCCFEGLGGTGPAGTGSEYSTVPYCTVPYCSVPYSTVQYSLVPGPAPGPACRRGGAVRAVGAGHSTGSGRAPWEPEGCLGDGPARAPLEGAGSRKRPAPLWCGGARARALMWAQSWLR
jgi:hypothetical protein